MFKKSAVKKLAVFSVSLCLTLTWYSLSSFGRGAKLPQNNSSAAKYVKVAVSKNSILYTNAQYGFTFSLPKGWKGYTIVNSTWEGLPVGGAGQEVVESGPIISIRHPEWTKEVPRQDIPIMVFTVEQWNSLQKGEFYISAAPVGPSELGHNLRYIFALPPRYNFAFPKGFEEVEEILKSHPLRIIRNIK